MNIFRRLAKAAPGLAQGMQQGQDMALKQGNAQLQQDKYQSDLINQLAEQAARERAFQQNKEQQDRSYELQKQQFSLDQDKFGLAKDAAAPVDLSGLGSNAEFAKTFPGIDLKSIRPHSTQEELISKWFGARYGDTPEEISLKRANAAKALAEAAKAGRDINGPKEFKKEQYDAAGFAQRMKQAEDIFSGLENRGYDRSSRLEGLKSALPGVLQGNDTKVQDQAERNFVNAVLRRESGAAISPEEFANAQAQYFPRAGDPAEVLANKKANRQQAAQAIGAAAGGAMDQVGYVRPPAGGPTKKKPVERAPLYAPSVGETKEYQGVTYKKIGNQWVPQ